MITSCQWIKMHLLSQQSIDKILCVSGCEWVPETITLYPSSLPHRSRAHDFLVAAV